MVANKAAGTGSAFDFVSDYNTDSAASGFYGTGSSAAWKSWNGDGNVFLFIRYRTQCFSKYHESHTNFVHHEPDIKEFWISPKAWSYVNGTGAAWSNNYVGMVLDVLPSVYSDPCLGAYPGHAYLNLPKYYYWNIPLDTCSSSVPSGSIVKRETLPNTTTWAWGTPDEFYAWTSSTQRQDLLGSGVDDWGSFNPDPTVDTYPNNPNAFYEYQLFGFNKNYSSIDGFPYGIGHAWGGDLLAPAPWCPCTEAQITNPDGEWNNWTTTPPIGETDVPCPCGSLGGDEWAYGAWGDRNNVVSTNSRKCCTPTAQQTPVYMLDKTQTSALGGSLTPNSWDHTTWAGGVPSNIIWSQCSTAAPDNCCSGDDECLQCGDSACGSCFKEHSNCGYCNCAACCETVIKLHPECADQWSFSPCVQAAEYLCTSEWDINCPNDPCWDEYDGSGTCADCF